jgi:hypothetical protein
MLAIYLHTKIACSILLSALFAASGCHASRSAATSFQAGDERAAYMNSSAPQDDHLKPTPDLSPEQVITIQLQALQHNDSPAKDSGIAVAFRFASPANQAMTGPLENFIRLVKNPVYRPMLNHQEAARGTLRVVGDQAQQRVTLTGASGEKFVYIFTLSKQKDEPYKDCWMTDGVERLTDDGPTKALPIASGNGHLRGRERA